MAPSSYYAAKTPAPSARARRDEELIPQLIALWESNCCVYGVRKLWKAARRTGIMISRDQVARLMRAAGIEGASTVEAGRDDQAGSDVGAAPGSGQAGVHRDAGSQFTSVGSAEGLVESGGLCRQCDGFHHYGLEFDRGQFPESSLPALAVVDPLDPLHDREA